MSLSYLSFMLIRQLQIPKGSLNGKAETFNVIASITLYSLINILERLKIIKVNSTRIRNNVKDSNLCTQ